MVKKQKNLHDKSVSKTDIESSINRIKNRMEKVEDRNEEEREFTENVLREFPNNVRNIETKAQYYEVTKTQEAPLDYYKNKYERNPQFGD